jgi:hypothetical protein
LERIVNFYYGKANELIFLERDGHSCVTWELSHCQLCGSATWDLNKGRDGTADIDECGSIWRVAGGLCRWRHELLNGVGGDASGISTCPAHAMAEIERRLQILPDFRDRLLGRRLQLIKPGNFAR